MCRLFCLSDQYCYVEVFLKILQKAFTDSWYSLQAGLQLGWNFPRILFNKARRPDKDSPRTFTPLSQGTGTQGATAVPEGTGPRCLHFSTLALSPYSGDLYQVGKHCLGSSVFPQRVPSSRNNKAETNKTPDGVVQKQICTLSKGTYLDKDSTLKFRVFGGKV